MSGKNVKQIRRQVRKQADKIKIQGLQEFVIFCNSKSFFKRVKIAWMIVFKKLNY